MLNVKVTIVCLFIFNFSLSAQSEKHKLTTFLESQESSSKVFVMVRHAEKQAGDDPSLTHEGLERASKLTKMMLPLSWSALYSSEYKRTVETVQELSMKTNLDLRLYNPGELSLFKNQLLDESGRYYLISGHSDTTPILANLLCDCSDFQEIDDRDYSNIYVVVIEDNKTSTHKFKF